MSLKKFLDAGLMVMGSPYDTKLKPLGSMSGAAQKRQGYADSNGNWTDRGFDRATSTDYQGLEKSRKAVIKTKA
ncbi:hypothetical protein [Collimonas arenae]|uniref:hypothetical protein n=1 Tax=Collimonas arenae TaxID=279058 RepID=UPI00056FE596|nr:hypothetical protein [Collimonas arenae]